MIQMAEETPDRGRRRFSYLWEGPDPLSVPWGALFTGGTVGWTLAWALSASTGWVIAWMVWTLLLGIGIWGEATFGPFDKKS